MPKQKRESNPAVTTLKTFGRSHRDEPLHLVYPLIFYPRKSKIDPIALADWCAVRYLNSRKKTGARYRIDRYRHKDGKFYVNRLLLEKLTDDEMVELAMKFGTEFLRTKQVRTGKLQRPRLNKEEKAARDAWLNNFYNDVARRRREAAEAQRSLAL